MLGLKDPEPLSPYLKLLIFGKSEDIIIRHDQILQTIEKIVMGPLIGLEFKSEIIEIESKIQKFFNEIGRAHV